jgi:hypothetical protein
LISDEVLQAILGSVSGINFVVKAHHVIEFLQRLREYMVERIPITSCTFADGRKWSVLSLPKLLDYILQLPRYKTAFQGQTTVFY